jgi:O-antigen/teichoic acid export membrane protein
MSRSKKIFSGFFWSLLINIINAFYGFISVPLLLVYFGKEEYGLIGLAASINVYLKLMDMGLSSGNVKFFSNFIAKNENENLIKLFQSSLVLYSIIGFLNLLVIYLISIYAGDIFYLNQSQEIVLKSLLYILMITSIGSWFSSALEQYLRANDYIGWHQRIIIIPKIIQVVLLVCTLYFNISLILFFGIQSLSALIVIPFFIFKIKKINPFISFKLQYNHTVFRSVLFYSISIFSFSIFQFSANYLRPIILGMKIGLGSVAEYRIIEGFANLVMLLGVSFVGVILPTASKVRALGDKVKENQIAYDGTRYITVFLSITIFGFILVSEDLLKLYVGQEYLHLVVWLNIWVLTLLGTHNSALSSLVLSNDNLKPIVFMSGFSTCISLILAWYLTDVFLIGGVVLGYAIYVLFQLSFYYFYYYPKVMGYDSLKIFIFSFLKPMILIGFVFISTYFISKITLYAFNGFTKIIFTEIFFVIISIPIVYFLVLTIDDKLFFKKIILNIFKNE